MAGKQDIRAGGAFVELSLRNADFLKGLRNSLGMLKTFAAGFVAFKGLGKLKDIIEAPIKALLETGDALDKMRQRTGVSVEALSELAHAAEQSGTNMETVEGAIAKMQKGITSGSKEFAKFGISLEKLNGMKPEQQFHAIADQIRLIENPTKRAAAAMAIFGKSGAQLLPMIEDMDELTKEARDMGFVMSGQTASSAVRLGDMIANLMKSVKFAGMALAEIFLPAIEAFVVVSQKAITGTINWIRETVNLSDAFGGIVDAMRAGEFALAGEIAIKSMMIPILEGLAMIDKLFGESFADFMGTIRTQLLSGDIAGAWETTVSGMATIWHNFVEGIVAVFTEASKALIGVWQKVTTGIAQQILALGQMLPTTLGTALLGVDPSTVNLAQAQGFAAESIGQQAGIGRDWLDNLSRGAQDRSRKAEEDFASRTAGGSDKFDALIREMQDDLFALRERVATERAAAEQEQDEQSRQQQAIAGDSKAKVAGSFSAAALLAEAGGRSPVQETNRILTRQEKIQLKIERALTLGAVFA